MTLYQFFLYVHLGGAVIMALAILIVVAVLVFRKSAAYSFQAKCIARITALQCMSGSGLALTDQHPSVLAFCSKLGLYLAIILIVEIVLFFKMEKIARPFPLKPVSVALGGGSAVALATAIVMVAQ